MYRPLWLLVVLPLVGCDSGGLVDHSWDGEDVEDVVLPVTCSPSLKRYPVNGPHNGGYDKNALHYSCHPHPSSAPDNSDFIKGDHYGNDIFAAKGTPLVSPVDGVIVKSGWNNVGGWRVTIKDGCGWHHYLAHLDTITPGFPVGAAVKAGQQVGTLGNTGNAQGTSPHLHYSIFPGVYESGIDPFPLLNAVDQGACGQQCKPHCQGSWIVGSDCGKGNCGAYGANCVDDSKGVRCVFGMCPAQGHKKICVDKETIGDCHDGALAQGKCSAYGANCVDDAKGARCVVVFCLDQPTKAHDVCMPDGQKASCTDLGGLTDIKPCPAGTTCKAGSCVGPSTGTGGGGNAPSSGGSGSGSGGAASAGAPGVEPGTGGGGQTGTPPQTGVDPWGNGEETDPIEPTHLGHGPRDADTNPVEGSCACSAPGGGSSKGPAGLFGLIALGLAAALRRRQH